MADILKELYNACDPMQPALPAFYVDCAESRGSSSLAGQFSRHLELAGKNFRTFLFTGHIGCGKSSELVHLKNQLENPSASPRYFVVYLNASEYLDDFDVTTTDILLAIVAELADAFRTRLNVELKDSYFKKRLNELGQFLTSEVEMTEAGIGIGEAKVKIQRLKKNPTNRGKVRERLAPQMSSMLEEINALLADARAKLAQGNEYGDIVLIVDNLEKIRRFENQTEGIVSHRHLFLEGYTQLTGLNVHVTYTVPLELARSTDGPVLEQRYDKVYVLPMVKISRRGVPDHIYEPGINCLRKMLQKRLGDKTTLDSAFEDKALEFLIRYSGGHLRSLMSFLQEACTYVTAAPIQLEHARKAVRQSVRTYSSSIPKSHWEKLARLHQAKNQQIDPQDIDYCTMLLNLSVLEYVNGDDDANPFASAEPWYAVNPIVRELRGFKDAIAHLAKEQ